MSAEATAAVLQHHEGTDAEWRMLAVLANEANAAGVISGVGMAEIAERVGKRENGAGQVKGRLIEKGWLVVLDSGGGRGRTATYQIQLPGLPKPPEENPSKADQTPPDGGGSDAPPSNTRTTTTPSSSSRQGSFAEELRDLEIPAEMHADGEAFLREKKKVGSKIVTPAEMAIAAAALATFNRDFEWEDRQGSEFGLGSALTSIVMRVREHPTWDAAKHIRLVESAWRFRWWERTEKKRRPTPNVIWGVKAFPEVVQDAKEEAAGKKKPERHYTRRDRG